MADGRLGCLLGAVLPVRDLRESSTPGADARSVGAAPSAGRGDRSHRARHGPRAARHLGAGRHACTGAAGARGLRRRSAADTPCSVMELVEGVVPLSELPGGWADNPTERARMARCWWTSWWRCTPWTPTLWSWVTSAAPRAAWPARSRAGESSGRPPRARAQPTRPPHGRPGAATRLPAPRRGDPTGARGPAAGEPHRTSRVPDPDRAGDGLCRRDRTRPGPAPLVRRVRHGQPRGGTRPGARRGGTGLRHTVSRTPSTRSSRSATTSWTAGSTEPSG